MLEMELNLRQDQITGFSYSFAKALLDRLNNLSKAGALWERYEYGAPIQGTPLTKCICHYLDEQIPCVGWGNISSTINFPNGKNDWEEDGSKNMQIKGNEVNRVIAEGYEFLSIFEGKDSIEKEKDETAPELAQNLRNFIDEKLDITDAIATRTYGCLKSLSMEIITVGDLLQRRNPISRGAGRDTIRNYGKLCHEWLEKEFKRLGFDVSKYRFFS